LQQSKCVLDRLVDEWPVGNSGLVSGGQTVHIEIFVIFAIGSGMLTGKVLFKPARHHSLVRYKNSHKTKMTK